MTKKYLLILISLFCSNLFAQECNLGSFKSNVSLVDTSFTNDVLTTAATEVNHDVRKSIEDDLVKFRVSTLSLASKDMSKEGISDWYLNMVSMNKLAFENIKKLGMMDDTEAKRWALSIVNNIVAGWLSRSFGQTMHEKSHIEAAMASGATEAWYATEASPDKKLTLGQLFLNLTASTSRPSANWMFNKEPTKEQSASIAAAGLNQQIAFSEKISDESIKSGKFSNTDAIHYFMNKISYNIYYLKDTTSDLSDLKTYTKNLADQGRISQNEVNNTMGKVANYTILTTLMSGRTWDAVRANTEYIKNGKTSVDILSFDTPVGKVTWPEFNTYLNSNSVSIKADTSLIRGNGNIHSVAIEHSVIGKDSSDVSVRTYVAEGKSYYSATARYNTDNRYGIKLEAGYNIKNSNWTLFAGADIDNGTLEGKRHFYNLDGSTEKQVYVGVEYRN